MILKKEGTSPSGSLPGVTNAIETFFLLATHRFSRSVRKSVAAPPPCLISWETLLLLELPIYSCEKALWGGGRARHPVEEKSLQFEMLSGNFALARVVTGLMNGPPVAY